MRLPTFRFMKMRKLVFISFNTAIPVIPLFFSYSPHQGFALVDYGHAEPC